MIRLFCFSLPQWELRLDVQETWWCVHTIWLWQTNFAKAKFKIKRDRKSAMPTILCSFCTFLTSVIPHTRRLHLTGSGLAIWQGVVLFALWTFVLAVILQHSTVGDHNGMFSKICFSLLHGHWYGGLSVELCCLTSLELWIHPHSCNLVISRNTQKHWCLWKHGSL